MSKLLRIISNKYLRKYFAFSIIIIFIAAISMVGATYAWFTGSSITLENIFTAGTVEIEVEDISNLNGTGSDTDIVSPGDTLEKKYEITNTGSKSIYVRARFEGYWERIYHKNIATATAYFNGEPVTDSDVAHFYYENEEPAPEPGTGTSVGFTDSDYLSSLIALISNSSSEIVNTSNSNNTRDSQILTNSNDTCPQVDPIEYDSSLPYFENAFANTDPHPGDLPFPDNCDERYYFKIGFDEKQTTFDEPYKIGDSGVSVIKYILDGDGNWVEAANNHTSFEVVISEWENGTFKFESNYPVYHVYVKGGPGGNLYPYYYPENNPAYPDGVTRDCGLSQPPTGGNSTGSGWSHIVFYFCEPDDDPDLKLKKEVSVDGGTTWLTAKEYPGPLLVSTNTPKFRFTVENSGNVTLNNIEVIDDVLDLNPGDDDSKIWFISELAPGQSVELKIDYVEWEKLISMNNIKVELCENMENWVPDGPQDLGTYFYHTEALMAQGDGSYQVILCVNITFEDDGSYYQGTEFKLHSYFEAVQASNDIILENWPEEDLDWYFE